MAGRFRQAEIGDRSFEQIRRQPCDIVEGRFRRRPQNPVPFKPAQPFLLKGLGLLGLSNGACHVSDRHIHSRRRNLLL